MISNEAPWLNLKDLVCLSFVYECHCLLPLSHPHFRINFLLNFWIGLIASSLDLVLMIISNQVWM